MAIDSALLEAAALGRSPLTLRLYRWSPPTVTLGRFQSVDTLDLDLCRERGIDVVRRPTGGRGVLHADEVTYSIVGRVEDGIPRGVEASYAFFANALVDTFTALGVSAALVAGGGERSTSGACYLARSVADLCAGALKLSGSAQVWKGDAVLQHGCFTLSRDIDLEAAVFKLDELDAGRFTAGTATLVDLVEGVDAALIEEVVPHAFGRLFSREFERGDLSGFEIEAAKRIALGSSLVP